MNEKQLTALRKGNIGFIFQSFNLIDELTVYENVELPLIYLHVKPAERKRKVMEVLDKVSLSTVPATCRNSFRAGSSNA